MVGEHIVHIDEGKPPTTAGGGNLVGGFLMRNKRSARLAVASIEHADRWFESNCHHHLEALVDQGLPLFLPFGITAEGFTFFKVHLGDVNSSGHHSVHTVVWLSCRKIGVALLVESGKKASPKRCSGDALNLNNFRVIGSPVILQQSEKRICFN